MSGTVNISRSIWRDTAFKPEPLTEREAFMWIIMEASYKPREKRVGNVVADLCRGQLLTSIRFMSEAWGWSKSRVDRFLKRLENRDMIGTESGTGINIITVCNYDEYQNTPSDSGTEVSKNRDSSGTAAGQQRDKPNKGLIPDAIQKKEIELSFAEFWAVWPNKTAKASAEKAWVKLSQHDRLAAQGNAESWFRNWREGNPQASPIHPASYLNQKRWTDEPPPKFQTIPGGQNDRPTHKSSRRMDAFIGGARGKA